MDAPPLGHDAATLTARTEKPKQPTKFARQLHDMPRKRESSILFIYTAESILFGRKNPLQGIGFLMKLCFQNTGCIHIVEPEICCGNIGMPRVHWLYHEFQDLSQVSQAEKRLGEPSYFPNPQSTIITIIEEQTFARVQKL